MKKRTKAKKPKPRLLNEITGYVHEYNVSSPGYWCDTSGGPFWVSGQSRRYATIRWEDGTESPNVPMPIIAQPCDKLIFTIRPA